VTEHLPLAHAEHARIGDKYGVNFLDPLINREEDDEEDECHPEGDFRPYTEPEPKRENRREDDARHRVHRLEIRLKDRGEQLAASEPEAGQNTTDGTDHESEDRLDQSNPKVPPNHSGNEVIPSSGHDIPRTREKERIQVSQNGAEMPKDEKSEDNEDLKESERKP
jgi:hypothetical protein